VLSAAYIDPSLTRGLVLLNAAGRFDDDAAPATQEAQQPSGIGATLSDLFRRLVSAAIFYSTKVRIGSILRTVYVNHDKVDENLIQSIYAPACDPNALEAFYRISGSGGRSKQSLNALLRAGLQAPGGPLPLLLIWGLADPWMKPEKATRIMELYPGAKLVSVPTGSHCPHDDAPAEVNAALLEWMATLA
jgi:pimeloyl-ACP methyl ester carboxylesterase